MFLGIIVNLFLIGFMSSVDVDSAGQNILLDASNRLPIEEVLLEKSGPLKISEEELVDINARSAIVVDIKSGDILYDKDSEKKMSIASITKLMTALVFLDHNPGWEKEVTLLQEDENEEPGNTYVYRGESVKVKDLFHLALIGSDNRAATALSRSTGLSKSVFVQKMNNKAKVFGLENTHFIDPTGLNPYNMSTAFEVSKLVYFALQNEDIRKATSTSFYNITVLDKVRKADNTNILLGSELNLIGGKTGYLNEAGFCLAVEVQGEEGQKIIAVVLRSPTIEDRFNEIEKLVSWSFNNYKWEK